MARRWLIVALAVLGAVIVVLLVLRGRGLTSRGAPSSFEEATMRAARRWVTPAAMRDRANPVPASPEAVRAGMEHWADHCASCHDNDGSGDTSIGRSLYPPAPDMRASRTQRMTDGELFYVIEQGVPFTGMPAWGNRTPDGERLSWELVDFIRHLPALTAGEVRDMERLNPRSAADVARRKAIDDFLAGGRGR
jgi:mono/diheme cytochrome c family protein